MHFAQAHPPGNRPLATINRVSTSFFQRVCVCFVHACHTAVYLFLFQPRLRMASVSKATERSQLVWPNRLVVRSPVVQETQLKSVLLRSGEQCRGVHLPQHRQDEIEGAARLCGMTLPQALSLRRNMMKLQALKTGARASVDSLGLGDEQGQRAYAEEVEGLVGRQLARLGIQYKTEAQLDRCTGGRPDYVFQDGVVINGRPVYWIDVKTFYGCGSLTSQKLAVGKLPDIARRYVQAFGPGAFAFYNGYHVDLEQRKCFRDVLLLDSSDETLASITRVDVVDAGGVGG